MQHLRLAALAALLALPLASLGLGGCARSDRSAELSRSPGPRPALSPPFDLDQVVGQVRRSIRAQATSAAGLVVSAESGFDQPFYVTHDRVGLTTWPKVAWNGSEFLVVWVDSRMMALGQIPPDRIWGTRVAADGRILDPGGLRIGGPGDFSNQFAPQVSSNGTDFLVTWSDERTMPGPGLYGTRVTAAGTIDVPGGERLSTAMGANIRLASDGSDYRAFLGNAVLRISAAGKATGTPMMLPSPVSVSAAAFGGDVFLLVWSRVATGYETDLVAARLDRNGTLLDASPIPVSTAAKSQLDPTVSFDGTNFFVAWQDWRGGNYADIYGARVSPAGAVLDGDGVRLSFGPETEGEPVAGFDGSNVVVAWRNPTPGSTASSSDIHAARVGKDGIVRDNPGIALDPSLDDERTPALACAPGVGCLVAWEQNGTPRYIKGALLTPAGTLGAGGAGYALGTQAAMQLEARVASDGAGGFLATWGEYRSRTRETYAARVTRPFPQSEPPSVLVGRTGGDQTVWGVGFDGLDYQVIWSNASVNGSQLYGGRVGRDGMPLQTSGAPLSTPANERGYSSMSCTADQCLLVGVINFELWGARLGRDGHLVDPAGIKLADARTEFDNLDVATDGKDFLVVWNQGFWPQQDRTELWGVRVSGKGIALDTTAVPIAATAGLVRNRPRVAFGGGNYLVVWHQGPQTSSDLAYDIMGARVGGDGRVLDSQPIAISTAPADEAYPVLAWIGASHLVIWNQRRNRRWDLVGTRVGPDGRVRDPMPFAVADDPEALEGRAAIASDGKGLALLVYDRVDPTPRFGNLRVRGRFLVSLPPGGTCSADEECDSGVCTGGVCCVAGGAGGCLAADAGVPDGAPPADAGAPDASPASPDLADEAPDATVIVDAAAVPDSPPAPRDAMAPLIPDSAPAPDAGAAAASADAADELAVPPPRQRAAKSGCACAVGAHSERPAGVMASLLLAALLFRRRRR